MRSQRSAAKKVRVRQRPSGASAISRSPLSTRPWVRCHVGLCPGLVDEDQTGRIKPPLILFPLVAWPRRDEPARWRAGLLNRPTFGCAEVVPANRARFRLGLGHGDGGTVQTAVSRWRPDLINRGL
jgi:hypothetical protein